MVSARNSGTWKVPCTSRTPFVSVDRRDGERRREVGGRRARARDCVASHWYASVRMVSAGPARLFALATVKSHAWYGTVAPSTDARSWRMTHLMCAPRTAGFSVPASAAVVDGSGAMRAPLAFDRLRRTTA